MLLWLLAAENDGLIPNSAAVVAFRLHMSEGEVELEALAEAGFLVAAEEDDRRTSPWPSRYVAPEVRAQVFARDKMRCVACATRDNLEVDHIVPVSLGGTGTIENLQTLCRSCNRKKRNLLTDKPRAERTLRRPSPETETETETDCRSTALTYSDDFLTFWKVYPRRIGKLAASKSLTRALRRTTLSVILSSLALCVKGEWRNREPEFIPHPSTWLNQGRWEDEPEPEPSGPSKEHLFAEAAAIAKMGGYPSE